MDLKGSIGGNVDKAIDQTAKVAKQKIGTMMGGGDKKAPHDTKQEGVGDVLSGALEKGATDAKKASDEAVNFGKKLFN